jgi:hypothetical protein
MTACVTSGTRVVCLERDFWRGCLSTAGSLPLFTFSARPVGPYRIVGERGSYLARWRGCATDPSGAANATVTANSQETGFLLHLGVR